MDKCCRWCDKYEEMKSAPRGTYAPDHYVTVATYGNPLPFIGESFYYHRVKIWGAGSEVIKECGKHNV